MDQTFLGSRAGVLVGVLMVPPVLAKTCKDILMEKNWFKKGGYIKKYESYTTKDDKTHPVMLAIPLSPLGVIALQARNQADVPPKLLSLLKENKIEFQAGTRVGEKAKKKEDAKEIWKAHPGTEAKIVTTIQNPKFRFIELFAGIGGFRLACSSLEGKCVFASEINNKARLTYQANFGDWPSGDITEIDVADIPPHDLLTAGFPCQSFSVMGKGEGLTDPRGNLFWEIIRILGHHKPRSFLLENVAGLITNQNGETLNIVLSELKQVGYHVQWKLINASAWVPQERNRIYIVGFLDPLAGARFQYPELAKEPHPKVRDIIQEGPIPTEYYLTDFKLDKVKDKDDRMLDLDGVSRTFISSYKKYSLCSQFIPATEELPPRFLTPREAARLQGFPDEYKIPTVLPNTFYKQIGNAVCPPVIHEIVKCIMKALES